MVARQQTPPPRPTPFPVPPPPDPLARLDEQARLAEQALLGCVLCDPAVIVPIDDILDPGDFLSPAHAQAYRCMVGLMHRQTPPDIVNVSAALALQATPYLTAADLSALVLAVLEGGIYPCFAQHYAEQIADLAERRRLVREAEETVKRAVNPAPLAPTPLAQPAPTLTIRRADQIEHIF